MKLRSYQIGWLEEYVTPSHEPKYTLSDGIGIIDVRFARQIQHELGLTTMPSAFQFRCLGCKGMVAVDPYNKNLFSNGGNYFVMFRDSQMKFRTIAERDIDFDVIKYSAPCPLKLHRAFIALLIALAREQGRLEIVESRIHQLFTEAFIQILKSLYDPTAFAKALRGLPKHFPIDKFYPEQLIHEPFFRSIVEVNAVSVAKQLNSKCQIPLPPDLGRTAFGVLDETGVLKPGQVFFQYAKNVYSKSPNPELLILQGKVGITKSPMFHPGDIRYVQAIDHPLLHHHKNTVVFCNHGARPLPDEIGGGDLDGDEFSVFWDPPLLLKHAEAADFPSPDTSSLQNVSVEELHHSHAEFRIDYELYNNLEQISNCFISHLVLHHPNHDEIEKIAKSGDLAVNSFKSGVFADAIGPQEKPVYFPAFMNKRHEPSFQSPHILNIIHKRCTKIYLMMQLVQDNLRKSRMQKPIIEFEASEYAKNMYQRYCSEITKK
uniref:RNA-dependent RNA polymerase n=1 Tax=Panagrolaimus superbus TaxID=310955 RepID=A0A914YFI8_9BILA